jgi:hypothetical protein
MDILQAARILHPGTAWNLRNGVLEQVDDESPRVPTPSQTDIQTIIDQTAYIEKRAAEYPPITDLADALVHREAGDNGVALQAYLDACIAVKNKYPKP